MEMLGVLQAVSSAGEVAVDFAPSITAPLPEIYGRGIRVGDC